MNLSANRAAFYDCTGCEIFGKGPAEQWCGLYARGDVRAKKCLITNKDHRAVNIIKNATILRDKDGKTIGAIETLTDMSEIVRQQQEIVTLRKTLHMDEGYHGIIGRSPAMQNLYELIDNVAQTESPVMIHGESGTGKELVARAVHEAGQRRKQPFIKVNCAALNQNLLESELFGHTRGAYTGADRTRIGRFEAAHGGTIFLDEIGDIPLSTQVKLLRVLEEKEIERVGDHKPIKIDVRIISATNKNLENLIAQGSFREDLYFRINVFPLNCPPLRDRKEDIPIIVQSFIRSNNQKTGKKILGLSPEALEKLPLTAGPETYASFATLSSTHSFSARVVGSAFNTCRRGFRARNWNAGNPLPSDPSLPLNMKKISFSKPFGKPAGTSRKPPATWGSAV